jgi:hypothetical protein
MTWCCIEGQAVHHYITSGEGHYLSLSLLCQRPEFHILCRDPIEWVKKKLVDNSMLSADDVKEIEKEIRKEVGPLAASEAQWSHTRSDHLLCRHDRR